MFLELSKALNPIKLYYYYYYYLQMNLEYDTRNSFFVIPCIIFYKE
jgi:hypothetical protein